MKRIVSWIVSFIMLFSLCANCFATEKEDGFLRYVEKHNIQNREELEAILCEYAEKSAVNMYTCSLICISDLEEVAFDISVDEVNQTVEVLSVYETYSSSTHKVGSAYHETYSAAGMLLYTVQVTGEFSYTNTVCSTLSASGSYTKGTNSLWSSTPTISTGNIVNMQSYARISGTATLLGQTSTYKLTLMCNTSGKLTTSFTRP